MNPHWRRTALRMNHLQVLVPGDPLHEHALDHTFPLWNDSLTREQYARTTLPNCGRRGARSTCSASACVSNGTLLASAKRYRVRVRIDGRIVDTVGIGAVFTPPEHRGHGHAAVLLSRSRGGHRDGAAMAMLFSEIAPAYYERLGFAIVPMQQALVGVRRKPGAPAVLVRTGEPRDFESDRRDTSPARGRLQVLARVRAPAGCSTRWPRSGCCRDWDRQAHATWSFSCAKKARALSPGCCCRWRGVASDSEPESWSIASCGDRDPSGARIGAMLQALVARTPGARPPGHSRVVAGTPGPVQLAFYRRKVTGSVLMSARAPRWRTHRSADRAEDVLYWHADAF